MHSNGYGHLMRLNGREGGSKRASGRQLMQVGSLGCCEAWKPQLGSVTGTCGCWLLSSRTSATIASWAPVEPVSGPVEHQLAALPALQLWDDLCDMLRVRQVSTEDVSNKASGRGGCLPPLAVCRPWLALCDAGSVSSGAPSAMLSRCHALLLPLLGVGEAAAAWHLRRPAAQ